MKTFLYLIAEHSGFRKCTLNSIKFFKLMIQSFSKSRKAKLNVEQQIREWSCNLFSLNKSQQKCRYANWSIVERGFFQTSASGWAYVIERKYGPNKNNRKDHKIHWRRQTTVKCGCSQLAVPKIWCNY